MRPGWGGSVAPGGWRGVAACLLSSRLSAASGRRRCAPLVQAPRGWRRAHATPVYNTGTDGVRTHRHREGGAEHTRRQSTTRAQTASGHTGTARVAQSTRDASLQHGHRRRQDTQAPRGWRRAHATPVYNTGTDGVRTHRHREGGTEHTRRQSTTRAQTASGHTGTARWRRAHATPV